MAIFQTSFTKIIWAGPSPAQYVTKGTWQKTDHLRATQGISDLHWPLSRKVLPYPTVRQIAMEWFLSSLVLSLLYMPSYPWACWQVLLRALSLQSGPTLLLRKEKGVKRRGSSLCISPALKGLGSLSWAKRWGHLHSTALTLREEPLFSLCLWGRPSSLWSSYPSTPRTGC